MLTSVAYDLFAINPRHKLFRLYQMYNFIFARNLLFSKFISKPNLSSLNEQTPLLEYSILLLIERCLKLDLENSRYWWHYGTPQRPVLFIGLVGHVTCVQNWKSSSSGMQGHFSSHLAMFLLIISILFEKTYNCLLIASINTTGAQATPVDTVHVVDNVHNDMCTCSKLI